MVQQWTLHRVRVMLRLCPICKRVASSSSNYCEAHGAAESNLITAYKAWVQAFEDISMKEFLQKVADLPETGNKAKEMARHLLEK